MRQRRDPRKSYKVTLDLLIAALDLDGWEGHFGGEAEGRRAYAILKDKLSGPGVPGALFWSYEADVPAELRGGRSVFDDYDNDQLELDRVRWLLGPGKAHQRLGEAEQLYRELGRLGKEAAA